MQRQFKKQKRDVPEDAQQGDLDPDARTEIESKRKANTLAARRSRQRKAEHLKTLETALEQSQAEVVFLVAIQVVCADERNQVTEERQLRLEAEQRLVEMEARLQAMERQLQR